MAAENRKSTQRISWKPAGILLILTCLLLFMILSVSACGDDETDETETVTVSTPAPSGSSLIVETPVVVPDAPAPAVDEGDAAADTMPSIVVTKETVGPCIKEQQEVRHVTEYSGGTSASYQAAANTHTGATPDTIVYGETVHDINPSYRFTVVGP